MSTESDQTILRLRKKHAAGRHERPAAADGERLMRAQSLRQAAMAALIAIVVFAMLWSMLTIALGRVLPWMTLFLGVMIGFAVRRAGQGLDWRFPSLAALFSFVGAILANIVVAAGTTAGEFDISTISVLGAVTTMTWPVFFAEVMTAADWVFALFAAGIATFYANRRLSRKQFHALRIWQEETEVKSD
jgi:hypothetical protein